MKSWKVFALALAVAGMLVADADAGGRRGRRVRGCSEGNCCTTTSTCGTASSCSTGSCGQVVESKPATKVEGNTTTTSTPVITGTVIYSSSCRGGRCR